MKTNFLKQTKVTGTFAAIAFVSGFFFLDKAATGNVVLNKTATFSFTPLIGLLLIFCSTLLTLYTLKKRV